MFLVVYSLDWKTVEVSERSISSFFENLELMIRPLEYFYFKHDYKWIAII